MLLLIIILVLLFGGGGGYYGYSNYGGRRRTAVTGDSSGLVARWSRRSLTGKQARIDSVWRAAMELRE
jgi:hypothetical protein